ncbi:MAG: hypothetical protein ABA06_03885 [Parcubacteria bacterium C7867-001]|nr:MAG: hypothetical protein ABA06_03885 [Parcubacteria bacterium C7867-001]
MAEGPPKKPDQDPMFLPQEHVEIWRAFMAMRQDLAEKEALIKGQEETIRSAEGRLAEMEKQAGIYLVSNQPTREQRLIALLRQSLEDMRTAHRGARVIADSLREQYEKLGREYDFELNPPKPEEKE